MARKFMSRAARFPFKRGLWLVFLAGGLNVLIARSAVAACQPADCPNSLPALESGAIQFDHGGRVLKDLEVQLIFLGDWTSQQPYATQAIGAIRELMNGPYMAGLGAFRNIGLGRLIPRVLMSSIKPPPSCTSVDIAPIVNSMFDAGTLPAPNPNYDVLYMVMIPHAQSNCDPGAGGWHNVKTYPATGAQYFLGLTLDVDGSLDGRNGKPSLMRAFSHELVEAATDPARDAFSFTTASGCVCEIGDVCSQNAPMPAGYTAEKYYSIADNRCIAPDYYNDLFAYDGTQWAIVGSGIVQMAEGGFGTIAETYDRKLFLARAGSGFVQVGTGPVSMLAVDNQAAYLLPMDTGYSVYKYSGTGSTWNGVSNNGSTSIVGGDTIYATDGNGVVHQGASNNAGSWPALDTGTTANQLVATGSGPWIGTTGHQSVKSWNGSQWVTRGAPAKQLYAGPGGIAATNSGGDIYWFVSGTSWNRQGGPGSAFAIGNGPMLLGLTPDHTAVYQDLAVGNVNPAWSHVGGAVNNLIGGGALVFATAAVHSP